MNYDTNIIFPFSIKSMAENFADIGYAFIFNLFISDLS